MTLNCMSQSAMSDTKIQPDSYRMMVVEESTNKPNQTTCYIFDTSSNIY